MQTDTRLYRDTEDPAYDRLPLSAFTACPIKSYLNASYERITVNFDARCPDTLRVLPLTINQPTTQPKNPGDAFYWPQGMSGAERQEAIRRHQRLERKPERATHFTPVVEVDSPCYICARDGRQSVREYQAGLRGKGVTRGSLGDAPTEREVSRTTRRATKTRDDKRRLQKRAGRARKERGE